MRWFVLAILLLGIRAAGQSTTAINSRTVTAEAVASFKAGDVKAALDKLQGEIRRGPGAPHEDLQLARLLVPVAFHLRDAKELARSGEAANLLLEKLAQPEGRMTTKDAAASYNLAGQIHEWRGDVTQAMAVYQRAVALDPALDRARQRYAHLQAASKIVQARAAANAVLQQRAQSRR